jgi:hypothetical protein
MVRRKGTRKNQKESHKPLRFTTEEIMHTIDAVQAAGLTVGVEITLAGAINISTQPPPSVKRSATPRQVTETDLVDETTPSKKLA